MLTDDIYGMKLLQKNHGVKSERRGERTGISKRAICFLWNLKEWKTGDIKAEIA